MASSSFSNATEATQHAHFDENGVPLSAPSICIPRVFSNISDKRIFAIFRELRVGFVEKIDLVERTGKDGVSYNMVFVHFRNWFVNDEMAYAMRQRLLNGEQVKIVYDEPWFWKVHAYEPKQTKTRDDRRARPFVDFEFREVVTRGSGRPAPPSRPAPALASISEAKETAAPPNIYSALAVEDDDSSEEQTAEQTSTEATSIATA